jgi:dipeptidyl aminopeptidase/acylaminoacyl peptidase
MTTMASNRKTLLLSVSPQSFWGLAWANRDSAGTVHPYLAAAANIHAPQFSPDGKWVALVTDESGQDEVYVRSFPDPSARMQISVAGGEQPTWSRDGHRLYYLAGTTLLAARITTTPRLGLLGRDTIATNLRTSTLVNTYFYPGYQVSGDGRILTILPEQNDYRLVVSPNWITELRRKVAEAGR